MSQPKPLILNKRRDFGACIEDAFIFLRRNAGPIFRCFLFYAAPIFLIGSLVGVFAFQNIFSTLSQSVAPELPTGMTISVIVLYLCLGLAYFIVYALSFAAISAYHDKGNLNIELRDITDRLWAYTGKLFVYFLLMMFFVFLAMGIVALPMLISPAFGFLFLPFFFVFIYFSLPMQIAPYILVHEKTGYIESFKRAVELIKSNWWATFLLLLVVGMIASMLSYLFAIPAYAIWIVQGISSGDPEMFLESSGFWGSLTMILYFLGAMLGSIFTNTTLVMKYYDLAAQKDVSHWDDRIDQIGTKKESTFENEGEF